MRETQNGPIQDGSDDATPDERVDGIVEQVRSDLQHGHTHETAKQMLGERFRESGVEVSAERLDAIARDLSPKE